MASFVEGRVRGQGAGSFPKESNAQEDTEQPGTPRGLPRAGQVQLLLDRQNGEGSSPFTLVASRRGAGFPVSSYLTLFGHWESDLVVLGSFRAFRCLSFTSSKWPGWALEVQEPMGLVSDGLWGPDLGGGMLQPSPGGGPRRRSPPGGALEEGNVQCAAAHICSLFIHSVWGAVLGDGCWIMSGLGLLPPSAGLLGTRCLVTACASVSEVCTSSEMTWKLQAFAKSLQQQELQDVREARGALARPTRETASPVASAGL